MVARVERAPNHSPASRNGGRWLRSRARSRAVFASDIVARHRHHALSLGKLQLENHHRLLAKRHFRGREIEFPHAYEARIVKALNLLAMSKKARRQLLSVSA